MNLKRIFSFKSIKKIKIMLAHHHKKRSKLGIPVFFLSNHKIKKIFLTDKRFPAQPSTYHFTKVSV